MQDGKAKTHEARAALDALLARKPVSINHTAVFGCSTKWNEHSESAQTEVKEWNAAPVDVTLASLDELKKRR